MNVTDKESINNSVAQLDCADVCPLYHAPPCPEFCDPTYKGGSGDVINPFQRADLRCQCASGKSKIDISNQRINANIANQSARSASLTLLKQFQKMGIQYNPISKNGAFGSVECKNFFKIQFFLNNGYNINSKIPDYHKNRDQYIGESCPQIINFEASFPEFGKLNEDHINQVACAAIQGIGWKWPEFHDQSSTSKFIIDILDQVSKRKDLNSVRCQLLPEPPKELSGSPITLFGIYLNQELLTNEVLKYLVSKNIRPNIEDIVFARRIYPSSIRDSQLIIKDFLDTFKTEAQIADSKQSKEFERLSGKRVDVIVQGIDHKVPLKSGEPEYLEFKTEKQANDYIFSRIEDKNSIKYLIPYFDLKKKRVFGVIGQDSRVQNIFVRYETAVERTDRIDIYYYLNFICLRSNKALNTAKLLALPKTTKPVYFHRNFEKENFENYKLECH